MEAEQKKIQRAELEKQQKNQQEELERIVKTEEDAMEMYVQNHAIISMVRVIEAVLSNTLYLINYLLCSPRMNLVFV